MGKSVHTWRTEEWGLSCQSATQNNLQVGQKDKCKLLPNPVSHEFWTEAEYLWSNFPHPRKKEHLNDLTSVRCESASLFISKSLRARRWNKSWEAGSFVGDADGADCLYPLPTPLLCVPLYPSKWAWLQGAKQTTSLLGEDEDSGLRHRYLNKPPSLN